MENQLRRVDGAGPNVAFVVVRRPETAGEFPSLGARGCFESHMSVLRQARDDGVDSVLIIEDDFDFTRHARGRAAALFQQLSESDWDMFYGAHLLPNEERRSLTLLRCDEPVITASFVAFRARLLPALVEFLEGLLTRPKGSPEYGPMHVDGAYTVFRRLHPQYRTYAAFPSLGKQRRSRSDITPSGMFLDRWAPTRKLAGVLRSASNWLDRL